MGEPECKTGIRKCQARYAHVTHRPVYYMRSFYTKMAASKYAAIILFEHATQHDF